MVNERMFINHNYLKLTETKHTKEETIMNRIKRGMVFSFDSSKSIGTDKYNALVKSADGKLVKKPVFRSRGDRDLGVAFQTHPWRQASISSGSKEPPGRER